MIQTEAKKDPHYAPLKVFDIIGYGRTATSPVEAEPMKYLKPEDQKIMNRNSLLEVSRKILDNNKILKHHQRQNLISQENQLWEI